MLFIASVLLLLMHNARRSFLSKTARTFLTMTDLSNDRNTIRIGFTGDVMIGRGIDAILPASVNGELHEGYVKHANGYVNLAIRENGPLPLDELQTKGSAYIWGDVLPELRSAADCLIINLETSLTTSDDWARDKGINYRAHPLNVDSLTVAGVTVATLANNHVLDWGDAGLKETLRTLEGANIMYAGAGHTIEEAMAPAIVTVKVPGESKETARISVVAIGFPSAGVPGHWRAKRNKCGVYTESDINLSTAKAIVDNLKTRNAATDTPPGGGTGSNDDRINVVSLHWGSNWGWGTPDSWRQFAHSLIDEGADVVVGHSSHHVKGIEVYKGKMIAYGMGDFLNDYEGIVGQGYEDFRNDLSCLYVPRIKTNGEVVEINIIPCKIKHLKVQRATDPADIEWLRSALSQEGRALDTSCETSIDSSGKVNLKLLW